MRPRMTIRDKRRLSHAGLALAALALLPAQGTAQNAAPADAAPDIDVVVTAPLSNSETDRNKVPVQTQVLRRDDLERTGPASALRALDERVGAVVLD